MSFTISYTPPGSKKPVKFSTPPLETTLISTPEQTGVADEAALKVMPVNKTLCSTVPRITAPDSFDFREEYWDFLSPILNQGKCGSCWAFASTLAFASRFAFATNQHVVPLSMAYMLYCIRNTFSELNDMGYGCTGGTLVNAYWFMATEGVVSSSCVKYTLEQWDEYNTDLAERTIDVGEAKKRSVFCPMVECPSSPTFEQPWLYQASISYIVAGTAAQGGASDLNICREIWTRGPVSTGFVVTKDLYDYWKQLMERKLKGRALVYQPKPADQATNPNLGSHAVQLVGWGAIEGVKYWIVANSWGATNTGNTHADLQDYGHNGYFLMVRGVNAGAIESNVVAGMPRVPPSVVGANGRPAWAQDANFCNLIAYEINRDTLVALQYSEPQPLPDTKTFYSFTIPPMSPETTGRTRRFDKCPADRPVRCPVTSLCVTTPVECGSMIPSAGRLPPQITADEHMSAARQTSTNAVLQMFYSKVQREKKRQRAVKAAAEAAVRAGTGVRARVPEFESGLEYSGTLIAIITIALVGAVALIIMSCLYGTQTCRRVT
jgi:cathepsin B